MSTPVNAPGLPVLRPIDFASAPQLGTLSDVQPFTRRDTRTYLGLLHDTLAWSIKAAEVLESNENALKLSWLEQGEYLVSEFNSISSELRESVNDNVDAVNANVAERLAANLETIGTITTDLTSAVAESIDANNTVVNESIDANNASVTALIGQVNTDLDTLDTSVSNRIAANEAAMNQAVAAVIGSSIVMQDAVINGMFNDPDSSIVGGVTDIVENDAVLLRNSHAWLRVQPQGGNDTPGVQQFIDDVKTGKRAGVLRDNTYNVTSLNLDYSADEAVNLGFMAPRLSGGSKRGTIIKQIPGTTEHVINVKGKPGSAGHTGKVTSLIVESMTIMGTPGGGDGVRVRSFTDLVLRDLWVQGCGANGLAFDRQTFQVGVSDEYGYGVQVSAVKTMLNAGFGIADVGQHPIGSRLLAAVEAEQNGLGGASLNPSSTTLDEFYAGGNGGPGLIVDYAPGSLNCFGLSMYGGRLEGNAGYEADIRGGHAHLMDGVVILATTGAHLVRVGAGSLTRPADGTSNDFQFRAGFLAGDKVTAGQKAFIIGGKSTGAVLRPARFQPENFVDFNSDFMNVIQNGGVATSIDYRNTRRTAQIYEAVNANADRIFEGRQFGDANRRFSARANGYLDWGDGVAAPDASMYRDTANRIRMAAGDTFMVDGTWDGGMINLGANRLWVDANGRLRIKNGVPASDLDGVIVGTQS